MKELICIVCPRGCHICVDDNMNITGNTCPRGKEYAINEMTHPTRTVTSTVAIDGQELKRLPVITSAPVPKERIFEVMEEINKVRAKAPVRIKDIIIKDVLDLGVDIVATRNIS